MINEFETKEITVRDYLHVRDLMTKERHTVWRQYECGHFANDELGKLVEAYDFVIDTLTELTINLNNKNNEII